MGKPNMVYTYNGILFNHNKEDNSDNATTWVNLEDFMLSVVNHFQKDIYCMISLVEDTIRIVKTIET